LLLYFQTTAWPTSGPELTLGGAGDQHKEGQEGPGGDVEVIYQVKSLVHCNSEVRININLGLITHN
jgi:hypothetical protein